jgi:hypothetical protein
VAVLPRALGSNAGARGARAAVGATSGAGRNGKGGDAWAPAADNVAEAANTPVTAR